MNLVDNTINEFCAVLASGEPTPGGGSTAALAGALGAALTEMVASLTVGRKKYAGHEELMLGCLERSEALRLRFIDIIDRDAKAFDGVSAVFAMPKETEEEKAARSLAMQAALKACTQTPVEMMECALSAFELISDMLGKFNENAASDLGVAALCLKAAVQGAWLNVLINLGGIKDEAFVSGCVEHGEAVLSKALPLADEIYDVILKSL